MNLCNTVDESKKLSCQKSRSEKTSTCTLNIWLHYCYTL